MCYLWRYVLLSIYNVLYGVNIKIFLFSYTCLFVYDRSYGYNNIYSTQTVFFVHHIQRIQHRNSYINT